MFYFDVKRHTRPGRGPGQRVTPHGSDTSRHPVPVSSLQEGPPRRSQRARLSRSQRSQPRRLQRTVPRQPHEAIDYPNPESAPPNSPLHRSGEGAGGEVLPIGNPAHASPHPTNRAIYAISLMPPFKLFANMITGWRSASSTP